MALLDISPLQKFLGRVRAASTSGARDIRLTTGEAMELTAVIGQLLAERLTTTQTAEPAPSSKIIIMDGGDLKT